MPDVNTIPLISERRLITADPYLEPRVVAEIEVGVEQGDGVERVLEREFVLDGLGKAALEVNAGPGVIESAADRKLVPLLVNSGLELAQGTNVERELLVLGREAETVVVEVIVGLDR